MYVSSGTTSILVVTDATPLYMYRIIERHLSTCIIAMYDHSLVVHVCNSCKTCSPQISLWLPSNCLTPIGRGVAVEVLCTTAAHHKINIAMAVASDL